MKLKNITVIVLCILSTSVLAEDKIDVGGTVRINYRYKDYNQDSKDEQGNFNFDMFGIKFLAEKSNLGVNAEYRLYNGGNLIKKAYVYYNGVPNWDFQLGVTQTPFGISDDSTNYALADSFWVPLPTLLGLDDNYDSGIKASFKKGPWATDIAYFKGSEYGTFGSDFRYDPDIGDSSSIAPRNAVYLRQSYKFGDDKKYFMLGGSVMFGEIYRSAYSYSNPDDIILYEPKATSNRSAYALYLDTQYDTWGLQAQFTSYDYESSDITPDGSIIMTDGFYAASKGQLYTLNVKKSFPMDWGKVKIFNDYNMLKPDESSFDNGYQNIIGVVIDVYAVEVIVDYIFSKNTPDGPGVMGLDGVEKSVLGLANSNADWEHTININLAYYF